MVRTLDYNGRQAVEGILTTTYSYAPEGLVDEIAALFGNQAWAPYHDPLFLQVRDSIWLTFPSKDTATRAASAIFHALDRGHEIIAG